MGTAPPSQACIRTCAARTPRRCPIAPRTCCVLLRPSVDLSVATFNSPASRPYFSVVSSASDCSVPKQACGGERRGEAYAVQCIKRRRVPACSASAAAADAAGSVAAGIHNQQGWQCAAEVTQGSRLCAGTAGAGTGGAPGSGVGGTGGGGDWQPSSAVCGMACHSTAAWRSPEPSSPMVAPCSPHLAWWPALACRRAAAAATAAASRPAACGLRARGMRLLSWLWVGGAAREGLHVAQVAGQHRSGALPHLAGPPHGSGAAACRHNARGGCAVCWSASAIGFAERAKAGRVPGLLTAKFRCLSSNLWAQQRQCAYRAAPTWERPLS